MFSELLLFFFFLTEQHFPEVMLGEEFLSLSLDQVCSLISSDKLTVSSEEKVCMAWPFGETGASWCEAFSHFQRRKKRVYFLSF